MLKKIKRLLNLESHFDKHFDKLEHEIILLSQKMRENFHLEHLRKLTEETQKHLEINQDMLIDLHREIAEIQRLSSTVRCAMQQALNNIKK